jgi:hypothetical protein
VTGSEFTLDTRGVERAPASIARANLALAAWTTVVAVGVGTAVALRADGADIGIDAPPLHARIAPAFGPGSLVALSLASAIVWWGPSLAVRLRWRALLPGSALAAGAWAVALASVRGVDRVVSPVRGPREYLAALPQVHDLGAFLSGFAEGIRSYPVHVQGHPPGTLLMLVGLRELGLGDARSVAVLFVAGGAFAVPALLVAVRDVAGEHPARCAAPFVVLAPAAIWVATSADAFYAGIATWGAALVIVATRRADRRGDLAAVAGGLLLVAAAFGSYGLVLVGIVPVVVAWRRRRLRPIALAGVSALAVVVVFATAGFWWFDGLAATRGRYLAGIASRRPYVAFLFVNAAACAVAIGPATAVALARLRDRNLWLLVGGGLVAVAIAAVSGMSKGEVERIWLPFMPWILAGGAAVAVRAGQGPSRLVAAPGWLGVQAATALAIESLVRTAW